MRKDITLPEVENIAVAVIKEKENSGEEVWNVYLLNLKTEAIEGVLVSSTGYGEINGERRETSVLRHFLDVVPPKSFAKIEPIVEEVFGMANQYWVSFYQNKVMYDKKYIFLAESITADNMITIPLLNKKGVMIK